MTGSCVTTAIPCQAVARVSPTPLRHARFENFFNSRRTMLRLGVDEVVTPTLVDGEFEDALLAPDSFFGRSVPLRNPLTADRSHLRSTLLPSLLRVLMTNRAQSLPDLDIYEIGRVFGGSADSQVTERQHLAILRRRLVLAHVRHRLRRLQRRPDDELSAERSANVVVDGKVVGCLGEIGPEARKAFDLPPDEPVFLAELDLEIAVGSAGSARFFEALPRYPGVLRDLAFVVPRTCRHAELEAALRDEGGDLLAELRLFDVYEGAPLDEREKSLAYTLVFRSPDRSLTHDEVDGRVDALVKRVGRQLDARLR